MKNPHEAVSEAADHVEIAGDHHAAARASHADTQGNLGRLSDLATQARSAVAAGQHGKAKQVIDELRAEAGLAEDNHATTTTHHRSLGRALDSAKRSLAIAVDASPGAEDPTKEMGAQTSAGQSPRSFTADEIRMRDQRAGCDAAYAARLRQTGARK